MTVNEMLARMSAEELKEWMIYYQEHPFGEERADLRAGMIAAPLINMWKSKNSPKAKPSDWVMQFKKKASQSASQMYDVLKGLGAPRKKGPKRHG